MKPSEAVERCLRTAYQIWQNTDGPEADDQGLLVAALREAHNRLLIVETLRGSPDVVRNAVAALSRDSLEE